MHNFLTERDQVEVLAGFGEAQLVRTLDMEYEIRGGSAQDREAAFHWIRKLFPELVWICSIQIAGQVFDLPPCVEVR